MSISYSADGKPVIRPLSRRLGVLMLANTGFAVVVLFCWTIMSLVLAEPLEWATWRHIGRRLELEDIIRYPFAVLWMWPLIGVAGAWLASKSGRRSLAYFCVTTPVLLLTMLYGCYYLTPDAWR